MSGTTILGWTLIHFLWQGAFVAAGLALLLALTGRRSPSVRYALCVAAMLVMAALPAVTALRIAGTSAPEAPLAGEGWSGAETARLQRPVVAPGGPGPREGETPPDAAGFPDGRLASSPRIDSFLPWLVGLWLGGVASLSLRLLSGWIRARRLTKLGTRPAGQPCVELVSRLAARLRVTRPVRVMESTLVRVPAVIGWLRPVLLIPVSLASGLAPSQLEALLIHELAHVRRHDYAVNLLQSVLETLLFYHPAVWWVSSRIRDEREHCCDDLAVAACGDPRLYAKALFELEKLCAADLGLAAAASGGSLTRRIRRILIPQHGHADTGHRWLAGAALACVVMLIAGGTAPFSPPEPVQAAAGMEPEEDSPDKAPAAAGRASTRAESPAGPSRTLVHSADGTLAERWSWAQRQARDERLGAHWIGYTVKGDASRRGWLYVDRHTPISTRDGSFMSGQLRFKGRMQDFTFIGVRLESLVDAGSAEDLAILIGYAMKDGRLSIDRIHAGHVALPAALGDRPLIWLGQAEDADSLETIRGLYGASGSLHVKEDLVTVVAAHLDARVVVPALSEWLGGGDPESIRSAAAEGLGESGDRSALAPLVRAAREDRSSEVRAEAAEAVGDLQAPGAIEALIELARTLRDRNARREAVEGLGSREESQAAPELVRIVREERDVEIAREAVETLGEFEDGRGLSALADISRSHSHPEVRSEAVETLAESAPAEQAIETLARVLKEDPSDEVRTEAVEELASVKDERAIALLVQLATGHPRAQVRREAVETLAEAATPDEVLQILPRIARDDAHPEVQAEAVETLGDLEDQRALPVLLELARTHPREEVAREAVETLAALGEPAQVLEALAAIAREHPRTGVQIEAVETMGELEDVAVVPALVGLAERHPRLDVQREAVETLGEVEPVAEALGALARLAGQHPSAEVQREAVETIGEIDDPSVGTLLMELAGGHPRSEVRREAVETLGESHHHDPALLAKLADMALLHRDETVRSQAIDSYAAGASPQQAVELLSRLARTDPSSEVQQEALEALSELADGAGIPALIQAARTHPNRELRRKAMELLADSDDPRAEDLLRRMLETP